jgi:hypothetical protein
VVAVLVLEHLHGHRAMAPWPRWIIGKSTCSSFCMWSELLAVMRARCSASPRGQSGLSACTRLDLLGGATGAAALAMRRVVTREQMLDQLDGRRSSHVEASPASRVDVRARAR